MSVTLGFDGEPTALTRLAARLEEVVRWAFGDLVELERGPAGEQPGLALRLRVAGRAHGWGLLRAWDVEPESRRGLPAPWGSLYLAPLAAHPDGDVLFIQFQHASSNGPCERYNPWRRSPGMRRQRGALLRRRL